MISQGMPGSGTLLQPLACSCPQLQLVLSDLACGLALPVSPFPMCTGKHSAAVQPQLGKPEPDAILIPPGAACLGLLERNSHFSQSLP